MFGCLAFLAFAAWIVFRAVHRAGGRKARWVLPAIEDPEVCTQYSLKFDEEDSHAAKLSGLAVKASRGLFA